MKLAINKFIVLGSLFLLASTVTFSFQPAATSQAAITKYINFQGKLTAVSGGTNVSNGTYAMEFKIYDAASSGTLLWTETFDQPSGSCGKVQVTSGVFSVKLGSCNAMTFDMTGGSLYLSVNFAPTGTSYDGEMSPRKQLVSSMFALVANGVSGDGVVNSTVSSATALAIAKSGTNYALQVDTSAGSAATGLKVTSAAAASGLALAVISSGTNENLTIDAKGSGTISLGASSTGNLILGGSTGDILLGGGSGSTGCTVTNSTGAFACSAGITAASGGVTATAGNLVATAGDLVFGGTTRITNAGVGTFITGTVIGSQTFTTNNIADSGALTIASGSATALTLNSGTTGTINIGTDASAETINIGNTGAAVKTIAIGNNSQANTITIGDASATSVSITDNNWSISTAGAAVFVGVNSGSGLLQGTGGLTVTGTTNINASGTSATNIGNSTGALVVASGGTSSWTNTSGNLTLQTVTSGDINFQPASFIANVGGGTTRTGLRFLEPSGTGTDYTAIQANSNVTTSYTWTLPAADASGCIQSNGSGALSIAACGGGSLTPWTADIDADGYDLTDLSNIEFRETTGAPTGSVVAIFRDNSGDLNINTLTAKTTNIQVNGTDEYNFSSTALALNSNNITGLGTALTASAGLTITATAADLALVTATSGNITLAPASTGSIQITSGTTTGTTTTSALSLVANSLNSGTGVNISSTSLTSGTLLNLISNGTAAAASQKGLNISLQGTNGTGGITSYGAQISNSHAGSTSTNVALQLSATNGTTANYALLTNGGNVGIGDTSPASLFTVGSGDLFQIDSSGQIGSQQAPQSDYLFALAGTAANDHSRIIDITQANNYLESTQVINIVNSGGPGTFADANIDIHNIHGSMTPVASISSSDQVIFQAFGNQQEISSSSVTIGDGTISQPTFNVYGNAANIAFNPTINVTSGLGPGMAASAYGTYSQINSAPTLTSVASVSALYSYGGYFENTATSSGDVNLNYESYGVYGSATGNLTTNGTTAHYGGKFTSSGSAGVNYGIYSSVSGGTANYSGIFTGGNVGIGVTSPNALLDLDLTNASSITTEQIGFRLQNTSQTLSNATTVASWRASQFLAPTINGIAGGGTETVTTAATLYIDAAPSGSNITFTNGPYALLVDAGTSRFDADVIIGGSTSITETLANAGFVMGGDDLFVAGMIGVEGGVYTDGSFVAGASTTISNGSISQSSGETLTIGTTAAALTLQSTTSGNIVLNSGGSSTIELQDNTNITGGLTVIGTTNINASGTAATNIGNSTGALVIASGGTSSWTNTAGGLTISTATSGTLALTSAAVLNITSGGTSALNLDSASGTVVIATGDALQTSIAGDPGTLANGQIWYNSNTGKYNIREGGTTKVLCNTTDAGCGAGGGGARLDQITAANTTASIDSLNNAIGWDWSTLSTQDALTLSASGTGLTSGSVLKLSSATTGAVTNGMAQFLASGNYSGTGGVLNVTASASTAGTLVNFTNNSATTGTILNLSANALTSGHGLSLASSTTGLTSGSALAEITLSGSNSANLGSLLKLSNTGTSSGSIGLYIDHRATGTGNLALRIDDASGDTTPLIVDGDGRLGIGTTSIGGSTERLLQVGSPTNRGNSVTYGDVVSEGYAKISALTGIKDMFIYDTTADSDGGKWIDWATTDQLSWYTESLDDGPSDPCDISTDDRCYTTNFPRKAIIAVTSSALYIFDASTGNMWMKFSQNASGYALGVDINNDPSSVTALNGVIYVGTNGSAQGGVYVIDLVNDRMWNIDGTDRSGADVGISGRNSAVTYNSDNNTAFDLSTTGTAAEWEDTNDVSAVYVTGSSTAIATGAATNTSPGSGQTFLALATDSGITVINMTAQKVLQYSDVTADDYTSVVLTRRGRMYALNTTSDQAEMWSNYDTDKASEVNGTYDARYDESVGPALWSSTPNIIAGAPDALEVIERGSLAEDTSDILYVGHSLGLTEIHTHSTVTNGWSKFFDTTRQTMLMPNAVDMALMMDDTSGTLANDISFNNTDMTILGSPTLAVSGVRGKAMNFDNTNDYLCSDADQNGTCDVDASFNMSTTGWTLSMWFKHSTTAPAAGADTLFEKCVTATPGQATGCVIAYMTTTGTIVVANDDDATWTRPDAGAASYDITSTSSLTYNDNQWHQLIVTRTNANDVDTFIDGNPLNLSTATGNTLTVDGSQIVTIGASCSTTTGANCAAANATNFWDGVIDDVTFSAGATTVSTFSALQARRFYNDARPLVAKKVVTVTDATTATSTTIGDSGESWIPNEFAGLIVTLTGGTGSGQTRRVVSNTATTITVSQAFTSTPDTTTDFEVDPEALYGASNSVYAIGVTKQAPLGQARQLCVGTNSGTDTGGVTCYNHQAGPNIIADLFHADAKQVDDFSVEWTGTDYDDIRAIDMTSRDLVIGSEAHYYVETGDIRLGQGLDYLANQLFNIRGELINDGITAAGSLALEVGFTGGADLAEYYYSSQDLGPGDVVVIDKNGDGDDVVRSAKRYSGGLLGVVSTQPGLILGTKAEDGYPIALTGRIPVKFSYENGPVKAGDYLTSASIPGYAMRATGAGPTIGKALADSVAVSDAATCPQNIEAVSAQYCTSVLIFVEHGDYSGMAIDDLMKEMEVTVSTDGTLIAGSEDGLVEESQIEGGDLSGTGLASQTLSTDEKILVFLKHIKQTRLEAGESVSAQLFTDRVSAAFEVITPQVTTSGLKVETIGSIGKAIDMLGDVTFFGRPYLNSDTAGFAVIKRGKTSVDVVFDKEYIEQPVVQASITGELDQSIVASGNVEQITALQLEQDQLAIELFQQGIQALVIKKSAKGFTILLNKPAPSNITFSWLAFAVKNPKLFGADDEVAPVLPTIQDDLVGMQVRGDYSDNEESGVEEAPIVQDAPVSTEPDDDQGNLPTPQE